MKNASTALKTFLAANQDFLMADLWTITLAGGTVLRYTTADIGLNPGNFFTATDVLMEGGTIDSQYGLEANSADVMCYPSPNSLVGGVPFMTAAANGAFNRANVTKQRLFMPTWGDVVTLAPPVLIFMGQVTQLDLTRYTCKFTCKDAKNLLNIYMPRRQYQPTCSFVFGDSNCGFDRTSLAITSSAGAGSALAIVIAPGLTQVAGYFNNGTLKFTSGLNAGLSRSIKSFTPGQVTLVAPFPAQANNGDAFTITPGCSKSFAGPSQQFTAEVTDGNTAGTFLVGDNSAAGTYNGMYVDFTSGANASAGQFQIQSSLPGKLILSQPLTNQPTVGDNFNINPSTSPSQIVASSSVISTRTASTIPCSVGNAAGFFNGGTLQFTSGSNVGQVQTISSWTPGLATMAAGFGSVPAVGDTFVMTSISNATQGSCTGYFGSDAHIHFGGQRFIPVPETAF